MMRWNPLTTGFKVGVVALVGAWGLCPSVGAETKVDFVRDVQPIFRDACMKCHGFDKKKGKLQLDSRDAAMKGGKDGVVIVAGSAAKSELYKRLISQDKDERMPQKEGGDPESLPAAKIKIIQDWINQGAVWPDSAADLTKHWAYQKPVTPPIPRIQKSEISSQKGGVRIQNPIDNFILARLEKEGLAQAPEASREILLRRVSLDLTGLPPTRKEVEDFLADKSPAAYEKVVDHLLASSAYGERWARPWLDMARYADTQGYEKDNRRSMWPYRDWVITALNENMSFDQFTVEQIAGDLLPNATQAQKIATGFHRNTQTNTEGGTDNNEFHHYAVVDRVNTTMSVWMGTTIACCQCHDHKYDPLKTKEYYQLYAFLNTTVDNDDDDDSPLLRLATPAVEEKLKAAREEIAALNKHLSTATPELTAAQAQWERDLTGNQDVWKILNPETFSASDGVTLTKTPDQSLLASGANPDKSNYTITVKTNLKGITGFRLEALTDPSLPASGPGRSGGGNFVLSEFKVKADDSTIKLAKATADHSQDNFPIAAAIDGKGGDSGWAISPQAGKIHTAIFETKKPLSNEGVTELTFVLEQQAQYAQHVLGKFRLSATTTLNPSGAQTIPENVRKIVALPVAQRTDAQKNELAAFYRTVSPELSEDRAQLDRLRKKETEITKSFPTTSVMVEQGTPRQSWVLDRGNWMAHGEPVTQGVPAVFTLTDPLPADPKPNRLTLARWLVSENNPLTARVMVNRFWEQYFGTGLHETLEDFGTRSPLPSHPELLDWLATEFMSQKWNMKAMHKLIVLSATYRQSAAVTPALLERDPYNRLLARGPRVRLEAEMVRDQALAISGLLSRKMGGPSVMPPQPDGLWSSVYSGDQWMTSKGEDKYRRGVYTFWKRTTPHPLMTNFDAPTREFCVLRRARSDTPLQALQTLNDPAFLEFAQALARRMIAEGGATSESRANYGFRACLIRPPTPAEIQRLVKLYQGELANYQANPQATEKMGGKAPDGVSGAEQAAWTVVANVLMNLDEMMMKE